MQAKFRNSNRHTFLRVLRALNHAANETKLKFKKKTLQIL